MASARDPKVVVVGAAIGGIATAIELQRHGFTDVTILERASDSRGTWFHNSYPGAACDVPSHLLSPVLAAAAGPVWHRVRGALGCRLLHRRWRHPLLGSSGPAGQGLVREGLFVGENNGGEGGTCSRDDQHLAERGK